MASKVGVCTGKNVNFDGSGGCKYVVVEGDGRSQRTLDAGVGSVDSVC